jgi:parafibromin
VSGNFDQANLATATNMAEPDALLSLRQSILSKKTISFLTADQQATASLFEAALIVLPQPSSANVPTATLPKSTPTRLRKPDHTQTDPSTNPTDFYGLDAVYLAWSLREAATAEYMKSAREAGIWIPNMVAITEKQSVAEWLEGKTDGHPNIVPLQGKLGYTQCLLALMSDIMPLYRGSGNCRVRFHSKETLCP